MKYGILMPYFNRLAQLRLTLLSFRHHYGSRDDWRVVIVVDGKEKDPDQVMAMVDATGVGDRCRIVAIPSNGPSNTPCREYNLAATIAGAEFVLPTNPECLHLTDILGEMDGLFAVDPNYYIVCACESVTQVAVLGGTFAGLTYRHAGWFQHSVHNNHRLNFCSALSTINYKRIGGFDEGYEMGLGYADDDFLDRVLAAKIPVVVCDDLLSLHQEHQITNASERRQLVAMNAAIYQRKKAERNQIAAQG